MMGSREAEGEYGCHVYCYAGGSGRLYGGNAVFVQGPDEAESPLEVVRVRTLEEAFQDVFPGFRMA